MNEAAIRKYLVELNEVILALPVPGQKPGQSQDGIYISHMPTQGRSLEDLLDCLRVQVKYLVFDLEATRRENRYLRQMLESRRQRKPEDDTPADGPES